MEKVIRNNEVAVIISPHYGVGWYLTSKNKQES